jgi:hypothetical protein
MSVKPPKTCYFCDARKTSQEHVPPQQMFKGFECDSITVPSCDEHNSKKSGQDQAIVHALLKPLLYGQEHYPVEPEIKHAIECAKSGFEKTKHTAQNVQMVKLPPHLSGELPEVSYLAPEVNLSYWIMLISAALIYKALGRRDKSIQWQNSSPWSAEFIHGPMHQLTLDEAAKRFKSDLEFSRFLDFNQWFLGWSAVIRPYPPLIYRFDIAISGEPIVMRHLFYNRYKWFVNIWGAEAATRQAIRQLLIAR